MVSSFKSFLLAVLCGVLQRMYAISFLHVYLRLPFSLYFFLGIVRDFPLLEFLSSKNVAKFMSMKLPRLLQNFVRKHLFFPYLPESLNLGRDSCYDNS